MAQSPPNVAKDLRNGDVLMVIHDFAARSPDELTLHKADRIELIELDEGFSDGWYLGRHLTTGATGLFPGVYTAKLPPHLSNVPRPTTTTYPSADSARTVTPHNDHYPSSHSTGSFHPDEAPQTHQHGVSTYIPDQYPENLQYDASGATYQQSQDPISTPISNQYAPGIQRSVSQRIEGVEAREDSPVMNETLSVIDEHITDLSTPRHSGGLTEAVPEDSESEYASSHLGRVPSTAMSVVSDDKPRLTPDEVRHWDYRQTADHLRNLGIEPAHCDIFEQQEISGDVILEMDQAFVYMKEYDFGVMGRRLKTWHKIRDFQNEVLGLDKRKRRSTISRRDPEDPNRNRATPGGMILPRIPSLMESPGLAVRQSQHSHPIGNSNDIPPPLQTQYSSQGFNRPPAVSSATPPTAWRGSMISESPNRPSAALVRELTHSRRNSSIEYGMVPAQDSPGGTATTSASSVHKKQASLDRDWSMSNATITSTQATTPPLRLNTARKSRDMDPTRVLAQSPEVENDRGYFSGNEVDVRKARDSQHTKETPLQTRQASTLEDMKRAPSAKKLHNRISSVDSVRDQNSPVTSPAAKAYYSNKTRTGRFRSSSVRTSHPAERQIGLSPTVTNLEEENISAAPTPRSNSGTASPAGFGSGKLPNSAKAWKIMGLRATSETGPGRDKDSASSPMLSTDLVKESPRDSVDETRTPSVASQSMDLDNTDASSKGGDSLKPIASTKTPHRFRPKTKQETSAYTMGLLKITPEEARQSCDHYGWMKKKSSGLMTTWKPRLFILRGQRLSYYYAEQDKEERGVIDIAGHKVLVANNDPITTMHATITGAATPTSPNSAVSTSAETSPVMTRTTPNPGSGGLFYFKLVPPKAGSSRSVQFTKPTVHYFQVNTVNEGRKWMGEILKATIEHDLSTFETTNKQKTISLAKARARKERPPALRGTEESVPTTPGGDGTVSESGLNIQGLDLAPSGFDLEFNEKHPVEDQSTVPGEQGAPPPAKVG